MRVALRCQMCDRSVMREWIVSFAVAGLVAGCGASVRSVQDGEEVGAGEGMLVFATDSEKRLDGATICREGSVTDCTTLPPLHPPGGLAVLRAPAGRYCVVEVVVNLDAGSSVRYAPDEPPCAEVLAGMLSYPGHFFLRTEATPYNIERVGARWMRRDEDAAALLQAERPEIAERYALTFTP